MAEVLLRRGFSVACMDFTGHGKSGGVFSTFGWREKDDVAELVKELRERRNINEIVLWGESQGAAAAIMYTESDSAISCMVLDSPFPRLRETFTDLMFCSVWGISLLVVPGINVLFSIIGFVALEVSHGSRRRKTRWSDMHGKGAAYTTNTKARKRSWSLREATKDGGHNGCWRPPQTLSGIIHPDAKAFD
eukprot:GHVU01040829.1.p1 GENE.GHVU01040829.1~~GHVU01040829.1.p1  ORF type:complete len:191 (+),score=21.47 GHVU01040829.1:763-1335(+)